MRETMEGMTLEGEVETRALLEIARLVALGTAVEETYGIRTAAEWQEWVRLYGTPTRTP